VPVGRDLRAIAELARPDGQAAMKLPFDPAAALPSDRWSDEEFACLDLQILIPRTPPNGGAFES
jgi:hypothetical protein